jgi:adenosyl cobinamide kinase/adenosyl cobinamide phosphate guanylyltransferase
MALHVLLGGARSGKSRLALELAREVGAPVTFIATAQARDVEMAERIARHRSERPEAWETVEEPVALEAALLAAAPESVVVIDCLSLWIANLVGLGVEPQPILEASERAAAAAAARTSLTVAVSNEVGLGIVPATPLGRAYRDLLGSVNRAWVANSSSAVLVVAGRALVLADTQAMATAGVLRG